MFYEKLGIHKKTIKNKASQALDQMTLKEKVYLLNGNWNVLQNSIKYKNPYNPTPIETTGCERLGIPAIGFADGPRGIVMGQSTCFPVSMARGASFDRDLESRIGDVIGKEGRAQGANYFAGICINLLRHPAWGRAQETYGEDPYHVGEMGLALTESVQDHNMMACLKHYAVNNIENTRFKLNVKADDRTMHEVYLPHFKKSVDAGAASLMGAYNKYNGDQCCESHKLQTEILRDMWGFEGFTSSDFMFGIRDGKKAIDSGMDVEMPAPVHYHDKLVKLVEEGKVKESTINTAALRVLETVLAFTSRREKQHYGPHLVSHPDHIALAREVAEKSVVLMKNDGNILPLVKTVKKLLVVGSLAAVENVGDDGSSKIKPIHAITQLQGLQQYFGESCEIVYCGDTETEKAKTHAKDADAVLIFVGNNKADEGEYLIPDEGVSMEIIADSYQNRGMKWRSKFLRRGIRKGANDMAASDEQGQGVGGDRANLGLWANHIAMIKALSGINPNTVVNLIGGSMIMTKEWDHLVPAIVHNWYSGMEGGHAIARILFGDVNPSGKLPFIVPHDERHLPYFSRTEREIEYDLYHGYTLLDKNNIEPMYAFGHGLSYTSFKLSNHRIEKHKDFFRISVEVTNTGKVDGEEVVQVYVGCKDSVVERQKKLLKGFDKVAVKSGKTIPVVIDVPLEEIKYFSGERQKFIFEKTAYQVFVGNSSCESALTQLDVDYSEVSAPAKTAAKGTEAA
ncbi:beta-glucosidase [Endozoicomonas sp.]|uniref:beta-glucosidase n=1 Tax=Endozoicomonas sp. TaxID=1892382 RepID=UPI002884E6C4|nr:glycoside hydrolase family 3 C-terminal domain-containing protein [Endozoicomonas sp.]